MTHPDEYQAFVQQLMRDSSLLDKQYKAFSELKEMIAGLKANAPHDAEAARSLERVNALYSDANFQALCKEAEKNLHTISRQLDRMDKRLLQADNTGQVSVEGNKVEGEPLLSVAGESSKRRQRHFV